MKILVISNMYPSEKSYYGIFVKNQIKALEIKGIKIIKIVKNKRSSLAYVSFILKSFFYLLFGSHDLVHAHYGFHSALCAAIIKRKPLITTFHGSDALEEPFRNYIYFFLQKFVVFRSDHIIAVSKDIKNKLISTLKAKPFKISIISCGVNTSLFKPLNKIKLREKLGIDSSAKVVLFAGSIVYMKGLDIIYKCAQNMQDLTFVFVGTGPLKKKIKNCIFVGSRSHHEMPLWMNLADILILPSRTEGTPVVVLEALSCGIPVISSKVGGCKDLIKDGQTGFLISINNINIFQEKIRYLLNNEKIRNSMNNKARKDIIEKFDENIIADKIKKIYNEILNLKS